MFAQAWVSRGFVGVVLLQAVAAWGQPTPTATPTARPGGVRVSVGSGLGGLGDAVSITVSLQAGGTAVAATGNDISFDPRVLSLDPTACRVNAAIGKSLVASVLSTDATTTIVRLLVQSIQNTAPIPDGALYTCPFRISPSALPGTYKLKNLLALAVSPAGSSLTDVTGSDGSIIVSLIGRACAGDCGGDGTVTVDELIRGVNIALDNVTLADCLSFDSNTDGAVTVDELIVSVNNALDGCITPPTPSPAPTATPSPPPVRLYVRLTGSDANDGADAEHALRTILRAAQVAQNNYQIIVGPGTYAEGVTTTSTGRTPRGLTFTADVSGVQTGDAPGPVHIDATGTSTGAGFKFSSSPDGRIDGFTISGGADGGIVLKSGSNNFVIENCIIHDNPGAGIRVQDSASVLVFNNLVYGNGGQGIGIVGTVSGSPYARVFSNTIFNNGDRAVTIGTTSAASPSALIRNNIMQDNGTRTDPPLQNIKVFPASLLGTAADFNLVFPATYLPTTVAGTHDVGADAAFNFPSGGDFHLRATSPAIDGGDGLPPELESTLFARTTTGAQLDSGILDLGFHFVP